MSYKYGEGWFANRCCLYPPLTEERAYERHMRRELLGVGLYAGETPVAFFESQGPHLRLTVLDMHCRPRLRCFFNEKEPGRLFMKQFNYRWYDPAEKPPSDTAIFEQVTKLTSDGDIEVRRDNYAKGWQERGRKSGADVSLAWLPYPEFGKYEDLFGKALGMLSLFGKTPPGSDKDASSAPT